MRRPDQRRLLGGLIGLLLLFSVASARAEITIVLQNDFIEHYKRKVTIDTAYTVDKAHARPNLPKLDGDLHVAGRADEVKLPIVAEIMNAKDDAQAVKMIHDVEGTGQQIALSGVWRIWCEHGGNSQQIQGEELDPFTTTNPPHVFEIHPIVQLGNRNLLHTLKPIQGFQTKDADEAFTKYEGIRCQIVPGDGSTTLVTTMAGYNYVEFVMEINAQPVQVEDGTLVMAKVRNLEGELLVQNRRMVLPKNSEVESKVLGKPVGTRLHVLGLPRIDLSLVSWRVQAAAGGRRDVLNWGLPYEIIVVGFYEYAPIDGVAANATDVHAVAHHNRFMPRNLTPQEIARHRAISAPAPLSVEMGKELPPTHSHPAPAHHHSASPMREPSGRPEPSSKARNRETMPARISSRRP